MTLIPKIPSKDHYHLPSKSWVAVIRREDDYAYVSRQDNVIEKIPRKDIRTYTEYISQFCKGRELPTKN